VLRSWPVVTRQDEQHGGQTPHVWPTGADAGDKEQAESLYSWRRSGPPAGDGQLEGHSAPLGATDTGRAEPGLRPAAADLANTVTSQQVSRPTRRCSGTQGRRGPPDAGKFFCFVKEDWNAGLAHLAFGSDAALSNSPGMTCFCLEHEEFVDWPTSECLPQGRLDPQSGWATGGNTNSSRT